MRHKSTKQSLRSDWVPFAGESPAKWDFPRQSHSVDARWDFSRWSHQTCWVRRGESDLGLVLDIAQLFSSNVRMCQMWWHSDLTHNQGCSYGGRRQAGPPTTYDFRPAPKKKKKKDFRPAQLFFFLVPSTTCMFHNRGSIIAQYVIYIENDLVRLWIPAGALPVDPQSLALHFVGFTHSACHYYSQLFSTTQIGLATTLHTTKTTQPWLSPESGGIWEYSVDGRS